MHVEEVHALMWLSFLVVWCFMFFLHDCRTAPASDRFVALTFLRAAPKAQFQLFSGCSLLYRVGSRSAKQKAAPKLLLPKAQAHGFWQE